MTTLLVVILGLALLNAAGLLFVIFRPGAAGSRSQREAESLLRQELSQLLQNGLRQGAETTRDALQAQLGSVTALREALDRQITEFRQSFSDSTRREIEALSISVKNSFDLQNQQLSQLSTTNTQQFQTLRIACMPISRAVRSPTIPSRPCITSLA